jgi:hypothetical protein
MTAPATSTVTDTAAPTTPTEERVPLVQGKLRREKGRALLTLDVSKLHAYLDFLGVARDASGKRFANCPQSRVEIVDNTNHAIVPKALCSFDYKKDAAGTEVPGVLEIDLLRHYQTPPTEPTLRAIAESVRDAATAVVTHYQPVEISINITGKKAR